MSVLRVHACAHCVCCVYYVCLCVGDEALVWTVQPWDPRSIFTKAFFFSFFLIGGNADPGSPIGSPCWSIRSQSLRKKKKKKGKNVSRISLRTVLLEQRHKKRHSDKQVKPTRAMGLLSGASAHPAGAEQRGRGVSAGVSHLHTTSGWAWGAYNLTELCFCVCVMYVLLVD